MDSAGVTRALTNPMRLRLLCERSGGVFTKLGQTLSLKNDILPLSYTEELLFLAKNVPRVPFVEMERVFMEDIGKPPELYFKTFSETPISSGSTAEIYSATLENGERVAVKIKRPNIDEVFERDFAVISFLADIIEMFSMGKRRRLKEAILEFIAWTRRELDFRYEAENAQILFLHSGKHPDTVVPKVYPEISTSRVLVSEYLDDSSLPVDSVLARLLEDPSFKQRLRDEHNISLERMTTYLVDDIMRQIFIDGFFHADPHPTNMYLLKNNKLGYIDFGIIGEASSRRIFLLRFLYGIAKQNFKQAAQGFIGYAHQIFEKEMRLFKESKEGVSKKHKQAIEKIESIIESQFEEDLQRLLTPWYQAMSDTARCVDDSPDDNTRRGKQAVPFKEKSVAQIFSHIGYSLPKYGLYAPEEVVLCFRAIAMIDMVANRLSPHFNFISALNHFFEENPLPQIETMIAAESHKKELGGNIESAQQESFEELIELQTIEKEKLHVAKERLGEIIAYYAEHHEDVRAILKS
ncbi:MAG: AarF/ABC1/UbiB kinase family protein [Candidatus Lloydbacteria bacterium]|nr:AarF/ABC1/UbiB kinase family protein [Candidatus Lloydbacteria bacterium]